MATNSAAIVVSNTWSQTLTDSGNANNTVKDAGQLAYNFTYGNGSGTGNISEVYHQLVTLASGGTGNYNLQGLVQNLLGYNVTKSFSNIAGVSIKNYSSASGFNVNVAVNSVSGFKQPFGFPTGLLTLGPRSSIHHNEPINMWAVGTGNRYIGIIDGGSGAQVELVIIGQQ